MTSLGTLSPELVILIVEELRLDNDLFSLRSLCLVNSEIRHLTEPALYRKVWLQNEEQCIRLDTNIKKYPRRALGILEIKALWTYCNENGLEALAEIVSRSCNLRELWFESPLCNGGDYLNHNQQWGGFKPNVIDMLVRADPPVYNQMSLVSSRLKNLVLHWQWGCWTIGGDMGILFTHPTLEHLTISCADIDSSVVDKHHGIKQTPLQSLTLIECNFNYDGLQEILKMPSALEYLYLSENNNYSGHALDMAKLQLLSRDGSIFFEALSQQRHSLRSFTYKPSAFQSSRSFPWQGFQGHCFANFDSLTSINLDQDCPDVLSIFRSPSTRPPCLQKFRLCSPDPNSYGDSDDNITAELSTRSYPQLEEWSTCLASISSLRHVEVVLPDHIVSDNDRETFARISHEMNMVNRQMRLTVIQEQSYFGGYIPPLLYLEPKPNWKLIFDSCNPTGVCQDIPYDPFGA